MNTDIKTHINDLNSLTLKLNEAAKQEDIKQHTDILNLIKGTAFDLSKLLKQDDNAFSQLTGIQMLCVSITTSLNSVSKDVNLLKTELTVFFNGVEIQNEFGKTAALTHKKMAG